VSDLRCRVAEAFCADPVEALVPLEVMLVAFAGAVLAAVALGIAVGPDEVQVCPRDECGPVEELDLALHRAEACLDVHEAQDGLPPGLAAGV
jgi:hypothetical protein